MSRPIIEVEKLSKRYRLGAIGATTLREEFSGWMERRRGRPPAASALDFWALRDVSFTVRPGEVVGVIGRNGAGKSTLLKVLSRITEPTAGRAVLRGRVASLLEVGTGFHPDLSGRENIFLNGAILGMTRAEVRRKFDEIVAFAEVERFIDTPVKRYSSGMYVRLAFAVAAHLEPEILIIDEVLAVGDAQFQKKCLGKMNEVATQHGRTVLFVSHNFAAIESLCTRALYLEAGGLKLAASTAEVERQFLADLAGTGRGAPAGKILNQHPALLVEEFSAVSRNTTTTGVKAGEPVSFRFRYRCTDPAAFADGISVSVIFHVRGQRLLNLWSAAGHGRPFAVRERGEIICEVPCWPFRTGPVRVDLHATYRMQNVLEWEEALIVDSLDGDFYGTGVVPHESEGLMHLPHHWHGESPSQAAVVSIT